MHPGATNVGFASTRSPRWSNAFFGTRLVLGARLALLTVDLTCKRSLRGLAPFGAGCTRLGLSRVGSLSRNCAEFCAEQGHLWETNGTRGVEQKGSELK